MNPTTANSSDNLLVANLQTVSLEKLVRSKLEVLFQQQQEAQVELDGLHKIVLEQVEKPLIELALRVYNGNQVKTAKMLGINRNTLKKKIDSFKIRVRNKNQSRHCIGGPPKNSHPDVGPRSIILGAHGKSAASAEH